MKNTKLPTLLNLILFLSLIIVSDTFSIEIDTSQDNSITGKNSLAAKDSIVELENLDIDLEDFVKNNFWGRNPFLPYANLNIEDKNAINLNTSKTSNDAFILKKILWTNEGRKAIINNKQMSIGEKVSNYTIHYIGEVVVILRNENQFLYISTNKGDF